MGSKRITLTLPSPRTALFIVSVCFAVAAAIFYGYSLNRKMEGLKNDVASLRNENHELRSAMRSQTALDNEMIQAVVEFYDEYKLAGDQTIEGLFLIADEVDNHTAEIEELGRATLLVAEQVDANTREVDAAQKDIDVIFATLNY